MKLFKALTPAKLWLVLFCVWLFLLSGALAPLLGSPGVIQAVRLKMLLNSKEQTLAVTQNEVNQLEAEIALLENSKVAQEREIRRVLGYAAPDEIIFDFTAANP